MIHSNIFKYGIIILIICLRLCFITGFSYGAEKINIEPSVIFFDHDKNSNTYDALSIKSYSTEDTFALDSIYTYIFNSPSDSVLFDRSYYKYNESGKLISIVNIDLCRECSSPWTGYTEWVFNENGNWILVVNKSWDEITQKWVPSLKVELEYIKTANTMEISYQWNKTAKQWVNNLKQVYLYNENGQLINSSSYSWSVDQNQWLYYGKIEKGYDPEGNNLFTAFYKYDVVKNEWVGSTKDEYLYENGEKSMHITSVWKSDLKQWINSGKSEFYYTEESKKITEMGFVWNSSENKWSISSKYEQEYDNNENILRVITYSPDSILQWRGIYREEYNYDELGNKTFYASYNWSVNSQQWIGEFKYEYAYNLSVLAEKITSRWNINQNDWIYSEKSNFIFDSKGNQTLNLDCLWNSVNNTWSIRSRSQRFYSLHNFTNNIVVNNSSDPEIYPNPATDFITITNFATEPEKCLLRLFDSQGRLLLKKEVEISGNYRLDISGIKNGIYFLNLRWMDKQFTKQIIKTDFK